MPDVCVQLPTSGISYKMQQPCQNFWVMKKDMFFNYLHGFSAALVARRSTALSNFSTVRLANSNAAEAP